MWFRGVLQFMTCDFQQQQTHSRLTHFHSKLMPAMMQARDARITMVGSVTGNDNTVGGGGVYPIADLHELDGFEAGFNNPIAMSDGYSFDGAKAYKDSKLCLMMLSNTLHAKYNKLTGISFSSIYPGCIAESPLFREKRGWFREYFPVFMKFITGGFVGEEEAGQRLFQVAHDPRCKKSGVYWSWNGGPREGRGAEALEKGGQISGGGGAGGGWDSIFENDQSAKVLDMDLAFKLFTCSTQISGAEWPDLRQVTSPCPTLNVIGGVSKYMIAKEEMKRIRADRPGFNEDGSAIKVSAFKKTQAVTDKVVGFAVGNTVGRVFKFVGKRLLGRVPDVALNGSYAEEAPATDASPVAPEAVSDNGIAISAQQQKMLEDEIARKVFAEVEVEAESEVTSA
jgi:light-dependent protochlorophyllide reductase